MKTVVYIDVYFILNFAVDLLCIYLCGMLSGKRPKKPDLIASALIGGVFSCAILIIESRIGLVFTLLICFVMYGISYHTWRLLPLLWGGVLLFSVSGAFGGIYTALISFAANGRVDNRGASYYFLLIAASILLVFGRLLAVRARNEIYSAEIEYKNKKVTVQAIIDSGNYLREPISGIGVALLSYEKGKELFSDTDISALMSSTASPSLKGLRFCPIRTASGKGELLCVKADSIELKARGGGGVGPLYLALSDNIGNCGADCILPNSVNIKF